MDHTTPALGAIPSPHDYRDHYLTATATPGVPLVLPAAFNTVMPGPVLMQAQTPSCVSHSVAQLLQLYHFNQTGVLVNFSPRFLDVLAKRFDGQPLDGGTIPRLVFKLAVQYGCATTSTVINDTSLPLAQYRNDSILTPQAFAEALKYRIPGFIRVPVDFVSFREAVFLHGAVSVLSQIGSEWWLPDWSDASIDPLRVPVTSVGGHQTVTKGWSDDTFDVLRNSWSAAWANKGEAKYNFNSWAPYISEGWVIADVPKDVVSFLRDLPSPSDFHYEFDNNMKIGDINNDVKALQIALMITGFLAPVDPSSLGIYGPRTSAAVGAFQQAHLITPPAPTSCGPKTRAALNNLFAL